MVFNRAKDWLDIEQILTLVPALQGGEIRRWLDHLVGLDDPRAIRYLQLQQQLLGHGPLA